MAYSVLFGPNGWGLLLAEGALVTLAVAALGLVIGLVLGTFGAFCKLSGNRSLSLAATAYTTATRGIPELIIIYLFYFGSSDLLTRIANFLGQKGFLGVPGILIGSLAVGFIAGALLTEIFRSAFFACSPGEREAARAYGMSTALMFRRIVAPAVLRHALPGMGNVWIGLLKESSLVSATGVAELMRQSQAGAESTGLPFTFYITASIIYLALALVSGAASHRLERHYSRGSRAL